MSVLVTVLLGALLVLAIAVVVGLVVIVVVATWKAVVEMVRRT